MIRTSGMSLFFIQLNAPYVLAHNVNNKRKRTKEDNKYVCTCYTRKLSLLHETAKVSSLSALECASFEFKLVMYKWMF